MKKKVISLVFTLSVLAGLLCAVSVNLSAATLPSPVEIESFSNWSGNANKNNADANWDRKFDDAQTAIQDEAFSLEATVTNYECFNNGYLDINFGCRYGEETVPNGLLRHGLRIQNPAGNDKNGITLGLYSQTGGRGATKKDIGEKHPFPADADISSFTVKIEMNSDYLVTISIDGKKLFEQSIATDDAERQFTGGGFYLALCNGSNAEVPATATVKNVKVSAASLKSGEDDADPNPGTGSALSAVVFVAAVGGTAAIVVAKKRRRQAGCEWMALNRLDCKLTEKR